MKIDFNKVENKPVFNDEPIKSSIKSSAGRKPLPQDKKKSNKITLYLTNKQYETILNQSKDSYMTLNNFICMRLFKGD